MAAKPLQITVPEPCSESWAALHEKPGGRYCGSCEKVVTDFSQFTDQELVAYFSNPPAKVCGRFTEKQLNSEIRLNEKPAFKFWSRLAASVTLLVGVSSQTQAQEKLTLGKPINPAYLQHSSRDKDNPEVKKPEAVKSEKLEISGIAIDAQTKEPLPFLNVIFKDSKYFGTTDLNGKFKLTIPDSTESDQIIFIAPYVGYEQKEFIFSKATFRAGEEITMELNPSLKQLGGMVVTTFYRYPLWFRVKNFFRFGERRLDLKD